MRPKSLAAKPVRAAAPPDFPLPLREAPRRAGAGSPFCILFTFKVYFYLSRPVVKERPAASRAAGVEIVFRDGGRTWTRTRDLFLIREAL